VIVDFVDGRARLRIPEEARRRLRAECRRGLRRAAGRFRVLGDRDCEAYCQTILDYARQRGTSTKVRAVARSPRRHRSAARSAAKARDGDADGDGDPDPPAQSDCGFRPLTISRRYEIPQASLYDDIRCGALPAVRRGHGKVKPRYVILKSDLDRYLAARRVAP